MSKGVFIISVACLLYGVITNNIVVGLVGFLLPVFIYAPIVIKIIVIPFMLGAVFIWPLLATPGASIKAAEFSWGFPGKVLAIVLWSIVGLGILGFLLNKKKRQ